ncbi:MAG TPA: hypothetical protein VFU88_14905 [Ktedonobacterales bacterium]|nr:hypothetical protein [Ktedonobacterales bacterium]
MQVMTTQIALVAARSRQRGIICRAEEQFEPSYVFRRARDYCRRTYAEWYILSTAHGVLAPRQVIGPGERPLRAISAEEQRQWAAGVGASLAARAARSAEPLSFVLFASQLCAELLQRAAPHCAFELPLGGLSLGERLRWYDERLATRPRLLGGAAVRPV